LDIQISLDLFIMLALTFTQRMRPALKRFSFTSPAVKLLGKGHELEKNLEHLLDGIRP